MNRNLIKLFTLSSLISCQDKSPSGTHFKTELIDRTLYCEIFLVQGGGVYGGDNYAEYLTDSNSFRYFAGEYDDNSNISYKFGVKDSIFIRHLDYSKVDGSVNIYRIDTLIRNRIKDTELNLWNRKHR